MPAGGALGRGGDISTGSVGDDTVDALGAGRADAVDVVDKLVDDWDPASFTLAEVPHARNVTSHRDDPKDAMVNSGYTVRL